MGGPTPGDEKNQLCHLQHNEKRVAHFDFIYYFTKHKYILLLSNSIYYKYLVFQNKNFGYEHYWLM